MESRPILLLPSTSNDARSHPRKAMRSNAFSDFRTTCSPSLPNLMASESCDMLIALSRKSRANWK